MNPQPRPFPPSDPSTAQVLPPAYGFPPAYGVRSSAQLAPLVSGEQAAPAAGGPMARDGAVSATARMAGAAGHAVGVAGYQTLRGAKAAGTRIGRFFTGVGYFFRGGKLFVTTPASGRSCCFPSC